MVIQPDTTPWRPDGDAERGSVRVVVDTEGEVVDVEFCEEGEGG